MHAPNSRLRLATGSPVGRACILVSAEVSKDPVKVRAGRAGAIRRWAGHERRVVRLASLLPEERAVITALLALKRARESPSTESPTTEAA